MSMDTLYKKFEHSLENIRTLHENLVKDLDQDKRLLLEIKQCCWPDLRSGGNVICDDCRKTLIELLGTI